MEDINKNSDEVYIQRSINTALRIGFIATLFVLSYWILKPFIAPVIWGIIIAVAIFPLHKKLTKLLGGKEKLSSIIIVTAFLAMLIIPAALFTDSTVRSMIKFSKRLQDGSIKIPAPDKNVADWPIVGNTIYETWDMGTKGLSSIFDKYEPQLQKYAPKIIETAVGLFGAIFIFIISIFISGAFLINTESAEKTAKAIFRTLAGESGEQFSTLASSTIRSVVKGVLGTSLIQTFFLSIGLFAIGFPGAGIVSILILFIGIVQLPLAIVMIPAIIYVFSYSGLVPSIIFAIWSLGWGSSDTIIKSYLFGKGVEIPMLVLLLGAMGGMIFGGIMGLFIGAVLLAFSYKILQAILQNS